VRHYLAGVRASQGVTWLLVALGLAAAALGLPAGIQAGAWATTAGGLLIAVASLPHRWGGFSRPTARRPAPTVHLVLWNIAIAGVIALTLVAFMGTSQSLTRLGVALYAAAAVALLASVDSTEVRLRRAGAQSPPESRL
jgi:hypothetical protein